MPRRSAPPFTATQATDAVTAIHERRIRLLGRDDPLVAKLSDHPVEIAEFVVTHVKAPAGVVRADVCDALLALTYARRAIPTVPATVERLEHQLMELGVASGLTYKDMQKPLGLSSRQAVQQRLGRHRAEKRGLARTDQAARRVAAMDRWTTTHGARLRDAIAELLQRGTLSPSNSRQLSEAMQQRAQTLGVDDPDDLVQLAESLEAAEDLQHPMHWTRMRWLAIRTRFLLAEVDPQQIPAGLLRRLREGLAAHEEILETVPVTD